VVDDGSTHEPEEKRLRLAAVRMSRLFEIGGEKTLLLTIRTFIEGMPEED
jgi:hypothetical protein